MADEMIFFDHEQGDDSFDSIRDAIDDAPHASITRLERFKKLSAVFVVALHDDEGGMHHKEFATAAEAEKYVNSIPRITD